MMSRRPHDTLPVPPDDLAAPGRPRGVGRPVQAGAILSLVVLVIAALGCLGPSEPETARAEITSENGGPVAVITSTDFALQGSESDDDVTLEEADTAMVGLPFENQYEMEQTGRFFIRVSPPDAENGEDGDPEPLTVSMRVFIDGQLEFDSSSDLRERELQFVFATANLGS